MSIFSPAEHTESKATMRVNKATVHFFNQMRLLKFVTLITDVHCANKVYTIPVIKGIGYSHCLGYEEGLLKIISQRKSCLQDDKSFIDVGVNVGQTLLLVKSICPEVRYVGFEPNELCVKYTEELIRLNNLGNTTLHPIGLSDLTRNAELNFYHDNPDDSSASVLTALRVEKIIRRTKVNLMRGDDLEGWTAIRPGLIKIDVEGFELEVLRGLSGVISTYRPTIICEILPAYSSANRFRVERQASIYQMLTANNYAVQHISGTGDVNLIDGFSVDASINACNYLFTPKEDL